MAGTQIRAPIHKNRTTTMARINGLYSTGSLFAKINLSSQLYGDKIQPTSMITIINVLLNLVKNSQDCCLFNKRLIVLRF